MSDNAEVITANDLAEAQRQRAEDSRLAKRAGSLSAPPAKPSRYVSWFRQADGPPCETCAAKGITNFAVWFNTHTCSLCTIAEGTGGNPVAYSTEKVQRRSAALIRDVVSIGKRLKVEATNKKLSDADVETIAKLVANGGGLTEIAKRYGMSKHAVEMRLDRRIAIDEDDAA